MYFSIPYKETPMSDTEQHYELWEASDGVAFITNGEPYKVTRSYPYQREEYREVEYGYSFNAYDVTAMSLVENLRVFVYNDERIVRAVRIVEELQSGDVSPFLTDELHDSSNPRQSLSFLRHNIPDDDLIDEVGAELTADSYPEYASYGKRCLVSALEVFAEEPAEDVWERVEYELPRYELAPGEQDESVVVAAAPPPIHWDRGDYINYLRMAVGVFKPLPRRLQWLYSVVPVETMVHVCRTDPYKIAYCVPGKEIVTTLGRFLRKFSEVQLSDKEIQRISEDYRELIFHEFESRIEGLEIKFSKQREAFAEAYTTREAESCMTTWKLKEHNISIHPAEAYASGDFGIFTLEEDGDIKARSIVSTKNKKFWTVYPKDGNGEPERVARVLLAYILDQGYERVSNWAIGCFLLVNYDDKANGYTVPYLDGDGHFYITEDEERAVIAYDWDSASAFCPDVCVRHWLDGNDAYSRNFVVDEYGNGSDSREYCEECDEYFYPDEMNLVYGQNGRETRVCDSCRDYNYSYVDGEGEYHHESRVVYSNYLKEIFLRDDDSIVYLDSKEDYYPKKECVWCDYDSEYEASDRAVLLHNGEYASDYYNEIVTLYNGKAAVEGDCVILSEYSKESYEPALEYDDDVVKTWDGEYALQSVDDLVIEFTSQDWAFEGNCVEMSGDSVIYSERVRECSPDLVLLYNGEYAYRPLDKILSYVGTEGEVYFLDEDELNEYKELDQQKQLDRMASYRVVAYA